MRGRAILSVLPSICKDIVNERQYRAYVCDSLQAAPQGRYLVDRYSDMIELRKVDKRAPEDIAADFIKRAGLKVKTHESI